MTFILSKNCCDCQEVYDNDLGPCDECCPDPCPDLATSYSLTLNVWSTENADEAPYAGNCTQDFTDPATGITHTLRRTVLFGATLAPIPPGSTSYESVSGSTHFFTTCNVANTFVTDVALYWDGNLGNCGGWVLEHYPFSPDSYVLEEIWECSPVGTTTSFGTDGIHTTHSILEITTP